MWRLIHKMMHNTLNIKNAVAYVPYQDLENKNMLLGLLERPDDFVMHLRRYTSSLTTQMVYGFRTISTEDTRMLQFFSVTWPRLLALGLSRADLIHRDSKNGAK